MRLDQQPGFVLHAQAWRETSLLLDVFTREHGRMTLVARGVRGARGQPLRAALQALQPLHLSWSGRGEWPWLAGAEAVGPAFAPQGDALLGAFYVNELLLRLLPRGEPHPALFWRYAECLAALQDRSDFVWELRRFERDLLAALGYRLVLDTDAAGAPIRPHAHYRYDPEQGALPAAASREERVSGAALLALGQDAAPDPAALRELRGLMRGVLRHHLGGRELRSWQVLADLGSHRIRPATADPADAAD